jgi:hypothetical protein
MLGEQNLKETIREQLEASVRENLDKHILFGDGTEKNNG